MRRWLLVLLALCAGLGFSAAGAREAMPILANRKIWAGFQGAVWMEGRARMGSQDVQGYVQGLGSGEDAIMGVTVGGRWDVLEALIGYLDSAPDGRKAVFEVVADGESVYRSEPISSEAEPELIHVPIKGKKSLRLVIRPESYGATAGAAWGSPMLLSGVSAEELQRPLTVIIDGKSAQVPRQGGNAPSSLVVPLPLRSGTTEYRVKMVYDKANDRVHVETSEAAPELPGSQE
ncbi:MAG: NPCBM/NEW2 domain-containing protein [Armatimonadetes bacterium]|nr:NPCBM/NEW2 domain-containing protein [Armatimonadota bacterium]